MHRRRFVQIGIAAIGVAAAGFVVSGLSRLVVSTTLALSLGAPLVVLGFLLAVTAFVLAVLGSVGVIEFDNGREKVDDGEA